MHKFRLTFTTPRRWGVGAMFVLGALTACTSSNNVTTASTGGSNYASQYNAPTTSANVAGQGGKTAENAKPVYTLMELGTMSGDIHPGDDYPIFAVPDNPDKNDKVEYVWSTTNGTLSELPDADSADVVKTIQTEDTAIRSGAPSGQPGGATPAPGAGGAPGTPSTPGAPGPGGTTPGTPPAPGGTPLTPGVPGAAAPGPGLTAPGGTTPNTTPQAGGSTTTGGSNVNLNVSQAPGGGGGIINRGGGTTTVPTTGGGGNTNTGGNGNTNTGGGGNTNTGGTTPQIPPGASPVQKAKQSESSQYVQVPGPTGPAGTFIKENLTPEQQQYPAWAIDILLRRMNDETVTADELQRLQSYQASLPKTSGALFERRVVGGPKAKSPAAKGSKSASSAKPDDSASGAATAPEAASAPGAASGPATADQRDPQAIADQALDAAQKDLDNFRGQDSTAANVADTNATPAGGSFEGTEAPAATPSTTAGGSLRDEYKAWSEGGESPRVQGLGGATPSDAAEPPAAEDSYKQVSFTTDVPYVQWTPERPGATNIYCKMVWKKDELTKPKLLKVDVTLRDPTVEIAKDFPDVVHEDEDVLVRLDASNLPDFVKGLFTLSYDPNMLSFRSAELGEFFDDAPDAQVFYSEPDKNAGKVLLAVDSNTELTTLSGDGPLLYIRFKAKQDIKQQSDTKLAMVLDTSARYVLDRNGTNILPVPTETQPLRSEVTVPPAQTNLTANSAGQPSAPGVPGQAGVPGPAGPAPGTPAPSALQQPGSGGTPVLPPGGSLQQQSTDLQRGTSGSDETTGPQPPKTTSGDTDAGVGPLPPSSQPKPGDTSPGPTPPAGGSQANDEGVGPLPPSNSDKAKQDQGKSDSLNGKSN
jgi:hypothetical protein